MVADGTFGRHLLRIIRSKGMEIPEFAILIGVNESTLRSWLSGRSEPAGISKLRTIKRLTGCTWKELLG